jgi:hypothetical protein
MLEVQPGELVPPETAVAIGAIAEDLSQEAVVLSHFQLNDIKQLVVDAKTGRKSWHEVVPALTAMKDAALAAVSPHPTAGARLGEQLHDVWPTQARWCVDLIIAVKTRQRNSRVPRKISPQDPFAPGARAWFFLGSKMIETRSRCCTDLNQCRTNR